MTTHLSLIDLLRTRALEAVHQAECATVESCAWSKDGDLPRAIEAGRRALACYRRAVSLLGLWLDSLPAVPVDGAEVLTVGVPEIRSAESRLDTIGLHIDALERVVRLDLAA